MVRRNWQAIQKSHSETLIARSGEKRCYANTAVKVAFGGFASLPSLRSMLAMQPGTKYNDLPGLDSVRVIDGAESTLTSNRFHALVRYRERGES